MFWQGVMGQDARTTTRNSRPDFWSLTDGSNKGNRILAAWTKDNTSSTIPALTNKQQVMRVELPPTSLKQVHT